MKKVRICIATTVKDPGPSFEGFLRYHLSLGIEKIFVFFDDPRDISLEVAKKIKGVVVFKCDKKFRLKYKSLDVYEELKGTITSEVQSRQMLNASLAMRIALKEGFDWLVHIDSDEIIFSQYKQSLAEIFALIPEDVEEVKFPNLEAVPETMDITNPFTEVTLFKKNSRTLGRMPKQSVKVFNKYFRDTGRLHFCAYNTFKSAARVRPGITPLIHSFVKPKRGKKLVIFSSALDLNSSAIGKIDLYHFPNCGFSNYLAKYARLRWFPDKYYKIVMTKGLHGLSRDAYMAQDFKKLEDLYRKNIQFKDPVGIKALIKAGYFLRNRKIKKIVESYYSKKSKKSR